MKIRYKLKEIEIPEVLTCPNDGGIMCFDVSRGAYICVNVEGCSKEISIKEYITGEKKFRKIINKIQNEGFAK